MKDTLFSPAFGNKPRTLVGRDMDMKCLKEGLDAFPGSKERARLVIGQRGLGKTVLLLELADYARSHGFLVASPTVVSNDMLDRIIEKLNREGERILSQKKSKVTGGTVGFFRVQCRDSDRATSRTAQKLRRPAVGYLRKGRGSRQRNTDIGG